MIPLLVGCSTGFIYFSPILYFASALIVLPACLVAQDLASRKRIRKWPILLGGLLSFLRGYEFSTVFALLTAFSSAVFSEGGMRGRMRAAALAFVLICLSFGGALVLHVLAVMAGSGWVLAWHEAANMAFANVSHRVGSLDGVPTPFGSDFYSTIKERWNMPAFAVVKGWPALSEGAVILLLMLGFFVRVRAAGESERIIYLFGVVGYLSWYVFAYQHIMWHNMYDWYIFSLTMGLAFSFLVLLYISMIVRFFKSFQMSTEK